MLLRRRKLFLLAAAGCFFGGLERVHLGIIDLDLNLDVGGKVADTILPFFCWSWICIAYLADGSGDNTFATLTVLYDCLA